MYWSLYMINPLSTNYCKSLQKWFVSSQEIFIPTYIELLRTWMKLTKNNNIHYKHMFDKFRIFNHLYLLNMFYQTNWFFP